MAEEKYVHQGDGQEVEEDDLNLMASSALIDDRVLAELLRLAPYNGSTVAKAIFPYRATSGGVATVQPSANDGACLVMPFRAVVGSRTAVSGSALDNWRDIRSGVFAQSSDATNLGYKVSLVPNASGFSRFDIVYAAVSVDANGSVVNRYQKSPSTGAIVLASVVKSAIQSIAIGVVTGTAAGTPTIPALPADAGGTYYIPLAIIRVVNGFGPASALDVRQIADISPAVSLGSAIGAATCQPASGNSTMAGAAIGGGTFGWGASSTARPAGWLPPSMTGERGIIVLADFTTPGSYSYANGAVIDGSRDWRNRYWECIASAANAASSPKFASDKNNASTIIVPLVGFNLGTNQSVQLGQSFVDTMTGAHGTAGAMVFDANPSTMSNVAASTAFVPYVDLSTGALKMFVNGAPNCIAFLWLRATAQYENF